MDEQETKTPLIVILVLASTSLVLIDLLFTHLRLGPGSFKLPLRMLEFVIAVSGLIAVRGWPAKIWFRFCAIAIFLGVICWTITWPLVAMIILPAVVVTEIGGSARINTQKARTIVIITLTFASTFIMFSPIYAYAFCTQSVELFFFDMFKWACFAVIPFAVMTFVAMWGWTESMVWKLPAAILHLIFALVAGFALLFICADPSDWNSLA